MARYADMPLELSVLDPQWETLDPTPDIRELFLTFDRLFFHGWRRHARHARKVAKTRLDDPINATNIHRRTAGMH